MMQRQSNLSVDAGLEAATIHAFQHESVAEPIDHLSEPLFDAVVTSRAGSLQQRVTTVLDWHAHLLQGQLPVADTHPWPEPAIAKTILERMAALALPAACQHSIDLIERVLIEACVANNRVYEYREAGIDAAPESFQEIPRQAEQEPGSMSEQQLPLTPQETDLETVAQEAESADPSSDPAAELDVLDRSDEVWQSAIADWQMLDEIGDSLAANPGRGWDLGEGAVSVMDLHELRRLRHWLKGHPDVAALVAQIGRGDAMDSTFEEEYLWESSEPERAHAKGEVSLTQDVSVLGVPMAAVGTCRSDELLRMLPQEAAYLGHPQLKSLWHARRAERLLISYQVAGAVPQDVPALPRAEMRSRSAEESETPKRHGPIIVCIDSSASMQGMPEQVAAAIALEVVRIANMERRPCLLINFSGPDSMQPIVLDFTPSGIRALFTLLRQRLMGGTDVEGLISHLMMQAATEDWCNADVLLVSDGRFPALCDSIQAGLAELKSAHGTRFWGVLAGPWNDGSMRSICNCLYHFKQGVLVPAS